MAQLGAVSRGRQLFQKSRNLTVGHFVMAIVGLLACFIILYPLLTVVLSSVQIANGWGTTVGYGFQNFRRLLEHEFLAVVGNTLIVSVCTTALAGLLGVTLAWISARTDSFGTRVLEPLNLIPFYLSPLIGAIAWTYLASPSVGLLNQWAKTLFGLSASPFNIYSISGIIWVMALFYTPYMYLFTVGSFKKMDPALEEAARTAGSGTIETTLRVTVPLMLPSILFGLSLTFVTSMGLFSVGATLGVPVKIDVLATMIYSFVESDSPDYNMASTLGLVILLVTFITFLIQRKFLLPREFTTVTGKGYRPSLIRLGKWRYLTAAFHFFYLLAAAGLPIFALFIVSISRLWQGSPDFTDLTLSHYVWVLFDYPITQRGIMNSLFLAFVGATGGMAFCFVLAYSVHKLEGKSKAILDFVVTIPIGVPSIVLSMGILVAYIKTPLYATIWIIMLAYITRYLPIGVKNVSSVLLALSRELEDSSMMCGASWFTTMRRILVPLVKPGLLAGWMILFLIFMRELDASILLYTQGNEVMSVTLFLLLEDAPAPQIAAYSMIQATIMLVIMYGIRKLADPDDVSG
ncbi:MAG: iron ABC transporter permease [Gammaproteobacteria bacterium]|nr:iron ABC transporter permease [Gammaproteobacteria bacterium]